MKKQYTGTSVVDFAWEVIDMQRKLDAQEQEITRLMKVEADYHKLLDSSIEHGRVMMGNLLDLCLTPGVVEACRAAKDNPGQEIQK